MPLIPSLFSLACDLCSIDLPPDINRRRRSQEPFQSTTQTMHKHFERSSPDATQQLDRLWTANCNNKINELSVVCFPHSSQEQHLFMHLAPRTFHLMSTTTLQLILIFLLDLIELLCMHVTSGHLSSAMKKRILIFLLDLSELLCMHVVNFIAELRIDFSTDPKSQITSELFTPILRCRSNIQYLPLSCTLL